MVLDPKYRVPTVHESDKKPRMEAEKPKNNKKNKKKNNNKNEDSNEEEEETIEIVATLAPAPKQLTLRDMKYLTKGKTQAAPHKRNGGSGRTIC